MNLNINTIGCYEVNEFYKPYNNELYCDGCQTEILESEQVFEIKYQVKDRMPFLYHTHNSQDCLKPWIVNNLEPEPV